MNYIKAIVNFCILFVLVSCAIAQESASESNAQQQILPEGLLESFVKASETNGEEVILYGQVLDTTGQPVTDASVEIWQTDANGYYDHPRDPSTAERDMSFQFYGSSPTNPSGWYVFRTILPGIYEPRPRHIHFKVKLENQTLLTSQFYFSDDIVEVQDEGMFRAISENSDALLLQLAKIDLIDMEESKDLIVANGQIIIAINGSSGSFLATPSQGEGPYYPVVNLANYDSDLTRLD